MLFTNKKFHKKTIGEIPNYTSYGDVFRQKRKRSFGKVLFIIICIIVAVLWGRYLVSFAQSGLSHLARGTVNMVSNSVGEDMIQDEFGNINILIVGYGGEGHAGSYLADSIMVASFNPKLGAVTMLSVPRDLYVHDKKRGIIGRINELLSVGVGNKGEFGSGAELMQNMAEEIMGLDIPYYALVDFNGFKQVIDTLGGIQVDVPQGFVDTTYPTENNGYMTVSFASGLQEMNGEKALQYARSRHSTSDFARSLRQQIILKAVFEKIKSQGITKLRKVYEDYINMVKTNISLQEVLGMAKYMYKIDKVFSYGLTTECSTLNYIYSTPGCFLYTPAREAFNGASVMIPIGGGPGNVSFYDYTQKFSSYVVHNQPYLIEGAKIAVMNGIDKTIAKTTIGKADGFANKLAIKLRKYALDVVDVRNFDRILSGTTIYVISTGDLDHTITTIQSFVPVSQIQKDLQGIDITGWTGIDIVLVLGNAYLDTLVAQPFNYYK